MGWVIALGVLLVLGMLPLGIRILYDSSGLVLRVIAGPLKITVFPMKKRPKKQKKKKTTSGKKQHDSSSAVKEDKPPEPPKPETKQQAGKESGGSLMRFLPLVKLGIQFLGDFRRKLRMDNLYLHLTLAGDDPCDLGVNYGRAWEAVAGLLPLLERVFVIRKRDIQVGCDFTSTQTLIVARGDITITLGRLLTLAVYYGVRILFELLAMKRKGGAVK